MGLEDIINGIIADAEHNSRAVIGNAEEEAEKIISKAQGDAAELERKSIAAAEQKAAELEKSELAAQELESKKFLLDAQKGILDNIYLNAEGMVAKLPPKDKKQIYTNCINTAKKKLNAKYVHCTPKDKKLVEQLAKDMKVISDMDGLGGLIIEDASRERMENYTFEAIMENLRESTLAEVYRTVFGGGKWDSQT